MTDRPHPDAEYVENYAEQTGTEPTLMPPIDVRVVEAVRVEEYPPRTLITDQLAVAELPVRLAGEHRSRAVLTLVPRGGAVFLGGPAVTTGTGFQVDDGASLTLEATDAVYAVCAAGVSAVVHLLAQVREG